MSMPIIRIAIAGPNGRMGQELVKWLQQAHSPYITLSALLFRHSTEITSYPTQHNLAADAIALASDLVDLVDKFDVLIDFTTPSATLLHLAVCQQWNKAMVIGTTGFDEEAIAQLQQTAKYIPIVYSANFSIGVNVMFSLLRQAARALGERSDIEIVEAHHAGKVDAPSGTALAMGQAIAAALEVDLADVALYERYATTGVRKRGDIGFSTIRGGDVIGEHSVLFLSQGERIEITHKASQRNIFAQGAIQAAQWLFSQPAGLYTMQNVLNLTD